MKKLLFIASLTMAMLLPATKAQAESGFIITDSIRSNILDTTLKYNVFVPGDFGKSDKLYPVVYLLHGLTDDFTAWRERGLMRIVANKLLRGDEICGMIIVMPTAGCEEIHKHWNGYFNMPGWQYEEHFFKELIPEVERKYHCIGDRQHRAVMGLSMGGGGSVAYAQHHPECFSCCFAMSPWLENKAGQVGKAAGRDDRFVLLSDAVNENSAIDFLDRADEAKVEELRGVKWFIDCGDDDYLLELTFRMYLKMREKNIKCELRVRDGQHDWEYWHVSLETALKFASRNFCK